MNGVRGFLSFFCFLSLAEHGPGISLLCLEPEGGREEEKRERKESISGIKGQLFTLLAPMCVCTRCIMLSKKNTRVPVCLSTPCWHLFRVSLRI